MQETVMQEKAMQEPRQKLESHIPLIRGIVCSISRRRRLGSEEADELFSYVMLKFLESDYAPLRRFEGRSSFKTYLTTVVHRLFLDLRVQRWGKWRPAVAARRLGPVAVRLDRLLHRDRYALRDAIAMLRADPAVVETEEEIAELALQIPDRLSPRSVGEEPLSQLASDLVADEGVSNRHRDALVSKAREALARAMATLPLENRLMLKMRYRDGLTVRAIAWALTLEPRVLYRRFEKCLKRLRLAMEKEGLTQHEVREILGWPGSQLRVDYGLGTEKGSVPDYSGPDAETPSCPVWDLALGSA